MSLAPSRPETFAELLQRLGDIPLGRIRMQPAPGTATADDVLRSVATGHKLLCELVDGVLVEKPMGHLESRLAFWLTVALGNYLKANDIGIAAGPDVAPGGRWRPGRGLKLRERCTDESQVASGVMTPFF